MSIYSCALPKCTNWATRLKPLCDEHTGMNPEAEKELGIALAQYRQCPTPSFLGRVEVARGKLVATERDMRMAKFAAGMQAIWDAAPDADPDGRGEG